MNKRMQSKERGIKLNISQELRKIWEEESVAEDKDLCEWLDEALDALLDDKPVKISGSFIKADGKDYIEGKESFLPIVDKSTDDIYIRGDKKRKQYAYSAKKETWHKVMNKARELRNNQGEAATQEERELQKYITLIVEKAIRAKSQKSIRDGKQVPKNVEIRPYISNERDDNGNPYVFKSSCNSIYTCAAVCDWNESRKAWEGSVNPFKEDQ